MSDELKFRALTGEDWREDIKNHPDLIDDTGLRLNTGKNTGSYTTRKSLESGIPGCNWHRIVIEADIPENSAIEVSFCTSETEYSEKNFSGKVVFSKISRYGLIQAPPGKYISLKIDLRREEKAGTPVLKKVKLYYPRDSYLRYLPAIYQEDSKSRDFLERFLSVFETSLYNSEENISQIPVYFDPAAAPEGFYRWLAGWLSLDLYDLLEDRNRDFILNAMEFYRHKGTVRGLKSLVSFLIDKPSCVKEYMNNVFRSYGMEHLESYRYLFNWDEIPENNTKLIEFLIQNFGVKWVRTADIERSVSDPPIITVKNKDNSIWLKLYDEKKVILGINNVKIDEYVAKEEAGKLNIYRKSYRETSRTVDTADRDLINNIRTFNDGLHYVLDTSDTGIYSPHVIGLFIFPSFVKEDFKIDPKQLRKIIDAFLPVFVRLEIIIFEEPFDESYTGAINDGFYDVSARSNQTF